MSDIAMEGRVSRIEVSHAELERRVFGNGTRRGSIDGRLADVEDKMSCVVTDETCTQRHSGIERREDKQIDIALVLAQVKASSRTQILVSSIAFGAAIVAALIGKL